MDNIRHMVLKKIMSLGSRCMEEGGARIVSDGRLKINEKSS